MSKRAASSVKEGSSKKRSKKNNAFGAPSAEDQSPLLSQVSAPSSTGLSVRPPPSQPVPSLINICVNVFAQNLQSLFERHKEEHQQWLKLLPDRLVPRVLSLLTSSYPGLSHAFIIADFKFFLRGDPIILTGAMSKITSSTIEALSTVQTAPKELHLINLDKISDAVFASLFKTGKFTDLQVLKLRGCVKVGQQTTAAIAKHCRKLKSLNLNFTHAPPSGIADVTAECTDLEVLKLAGIPHINDAYLSNILHMDFAKKLPKGRKPLQHLRTLKIKHTQITDVSVRKIAGRFGSTLSRLDVSFCPIRGPLSLLEDGPGWVLEKLSFTSTPLTSQWMHGFSSFGLSGNLKHTLRVLHMGALGAQASTSAITLQGNLTLNDELLWAITDVLTEFQVLEDVSLVGNSKLGLARAGEDSPLSRFVRIIGRKCKVSVFLKYMVTVYLILSRIFRYLIWLLYHD
ncbi:hypothetical protein M422DRAFT_55305 [Sphaerobolus stellatus SS14]|uniref:Uncharacterized protein n=1 Tax=Sphaerobolus stellatus (strain SS14) TaxID=990650 RepID=A0A0C9UCS6_SPHS4|nr:hypothetical protein M422DRAFT_55305 [Sphaerobolus stellatus SS14]